MRIKSYPVYMFDELSEKGKEKALESMRDINVNYSGWHDMELDYWKGILEELGFNDAEINYTGFWSQGDGASFTASIHAEKYIKSHKLGKLRLIQLRGR